jgi:AraC-like DNA-binding protein
VTSAIADSTPALSVPERRAAARRILCANPERSDRGIAARCGLSPKTVARIRDELVAEGRVEAAQVTVARIGRDGRVRPVDAHAVRERIAEELRRQPQASLRTIARAVGASPETVRSVRNSLGQDLTARRVVTTHAMPLAPVIDLPPRLPEPVVSLGGDRACTDRDGGHEFVEWFDATTVALGDVYAHGGTVPLSRVYEVADEARRRAECWLRFADAVEGRVRRRA